MTKSEILSYFGMACGVVGALAYVIGMHYGWVGVLTSGLLLFFTRLASRMKEEGFRERRLLGLLMFSGVCLCASAYFMMNAKTYWVIGLMMSAMIELVVTWRWGK